MADAKRIPMLPVNHWRALRRKFKQSIPGVVTDSYLATVLEMKVDSARANVLPFLKVLGIIDEDGKPTNRARLWRDDGQYSDVCKAILEEVYPKELLEAVPDPKANREAARRWFAHHTGVGSAACGRMVTLYTVLVDADPSNEQGAAKARSTPTLKKQASSRARPARSMETQRKSNAASAGTENGKDSQSRTPSINLNLQIHISADASPDQIEQIFAAMAKHIYRRQ